MIIHVSGASGSGKTTLGQKISEVSGDDVVVMDMDDMWNNFYIYQYETKKVPYKQYFATFATEYQKYIDNYIKEQNGKKILFVGINVFILGEKQYYPKTQDPYGKQYFGLLPPNIYFDIHANHKFYIDIDIDKLLKQQFFRNLSNMARDKEYILDDLIKSQKDTQKKLQKGIVYISDLAKNKLNVTKWNKYYKDHGYKFLPFDTIYEQVCDLFGCKYEKTSTLVVDHFMFPVYHNLELLEKTKTYWSNIDKNIEINKYEKYDNVCLFAKDFYIELLSTTSLVNQNQTNSICVEYDTKFWHTIKDPLVKNNEFLVPYAGCGYFFVNPKFQYTNKQINKKKNGEYKVLVSESLKEEIERTTNMALPTYIKTDKKLCHNYDIVILDGNKIIAPYLQSNFPLITDKTIKY